MAYSFKKKENIGNKSTEYSRYYSAFRGVDFSSDHSQVHESRLAYLVNMYKDYQSGQGEALETVAGFRQRGRFGNGTDEIYGIFYFRCKVAGEEVERVLVHCGTNLYVWDNYPYTVNILKTKAVFLDTNYDKENRELTLDFPCVEITKITNETTDAEIGGTEYNAEKNVVKFPEGADVKDGNTLAISYYEGKTGNALFEGMNDHKSVSFVFNNRLYILDGKHYLVYDGEEVKDVTANAYVPTTYINIIPAGGNANTGTEYEQRNILTPKFKHTFIADGETKEFYLNEKATSIESVSVYGNALNGTKGEYSFDSETGKITLDENVEAPKKPAEEGYPEGYAGVVIEASKAYGAINGVADGLENYADLISKCTLCATFDERVFLSGNPICPNHVFFCGRNTTGYTDPTYFGVLNYMQDGVGLSPITGMMSVSNTLMVLKADTQQDSAVYFHTGTDTNVDLTPRVYPSSQGLSGLGCVGACCNFLDDPIFISRLGVEGVSHLKVASERANEHRSQLIDAKLVNTDLTKASVEEWGGYLCVLTDGKIFLADSRQRYADATGAMQYEWYYLEGIGVWDGQYTEYTYAEKFPDVLEDKEIKIDVDGEDYPLEIAEKVPDPEIGEGATKDLRKTIVNPPDAFGMETNEVKSTIYTLTGKTENENGEEEDYSYNVQLLYHVYEAENGEKHVYLCETKGNCIGGVYKKATLLYAMNDKGKDNLFFGCENGVVCSFNFDQRNETGEIPATSYHFDNRIILSGCATLMDNCQIPHLTKNTVKRSTVIKTRSFANSAAKIKVRTNKKPYEQIARINSSTFSFDDLDFTDFSFITTEQSLFAIKENEKQWVEKQYYIYSDEYYKPFSLYYISFRYRVAGRYKN